MKAVIVDRNGNDAVALRDDGRFVKLKNENYRIGQQITLKSQTIRFPKQAAIAASAALVILAGSGFGRYTWSNPISYVSLDVNPSIAYSLNEFNRVIAVNGMNDEGVAVVDAVGSSLKNVDITTALTITVEQLSTEAYLDAENTNYMVIGVYSDKDSRADALMTTVDAFCTDTIETCSVTTVNVSKETKESADSYGITAGKMELINEIASVANDPDTVDPTVLADLTVAELEQTKEAAASGTSVPDAVAAVASPQPETKPDANAVASDDKSAETTTGEPKPDASSSDKKDPSANEPVPTADDKTGDNSQSVSADNSSSANNPASPDQPQSGSSTDKTGTGSSDKKDEGASSDKKDEGTSSDKKDETTSSDKKDEGASSDKKDEDTSSDKKDDTSEDSSEQTNSNLVPEPEPEIVTEIISEMLADSTSDTSVPTTTGNMLS